MSDDRIPPPEANDLAAEYALGVLAGDELRRAHQLAGSDPAFCAEVARWRGRLAPMLDEVTPIAAPEGAWTSIGHRLGLAADDGHVVHLRRRVRQWRGIAAGMSALAACLAVLLVVGLPRPVPPPQASSRQQQVPAAAPMVAMLGDPKQPTKVVASWDPATQQLILAVAGGLKADPTHSHELWVIPPDGKPRSLGTMGASKQMHMKLAEALAQLLQQGATIAISVEPPGGSPTGAPTGPVVASGALTQA